MGSNDLDEFEHLSIWKCSGEANERGWNFYMLSFSDSKLQTFLPFYTFEVKDWNGIIDNLPTWNIIKLEGFFFLLGFLIFHCSLVCLGLWSLIPLTKVWSSCCFPFSPKLIRCDGNYFSPFFLSLTNFVGCPPKKKYWSRP